MRGPMVAASALDEDGWLHTGDLGRFDDRGRLVITGRKADTIVTGGENVAPLEVEDVLLTHPGVADAAVFARADAEWGEAVVASVVLRDGATVGPEELRAFCAQRLAGFKVPKAFEFVPAAAAEPDGEAAAARAGLAAWPSPRRIAENDPSGVASGAARVKFVADAMQRTRGAS